MKIKTIKILVLLFLSTNLLSQTIFEIDVDKIYLDDDNLLFINHGEIYDYECELAMYKIRDYQLDLSIICEEAMEGWSADSLQIKIGDIKTFNKPKQLQKWLMNRSFEKETNSTNKRYKSYFQYFDNNFIIELGYSRDDISKEDWYLNNVEFWDYVFVRLNNKRLVIALVYEEGYIGGFIIPLKSGGILLAKNFTFLESKKTFNVKLLTEHIKSKSFFRVKKVKGGYQLYDKMFQEPITNKIYEEIRLGKHFITCKDKKGEIRFSKSGKDEIEDDLQVVFNVDKSLQVLQNGETYWRDFEGNKHDSIPLRMTYGCGTYSILEKKIIKTDSGFVETQSTGSRWELYRSKKDYDKITVLANYDSIVSIKYLSNSTTNTSDKQTKDFASDFSFPVNYYILETRKNKKLVSIKNKKDTLLKKLIQQRILNKKQRKSIEEINLSIDQLKDDISINTILIGEFESFGYSHPIKFKEQNLFGYYPINKKAKYRKLEKFYYFLAKFEMPNGEKGWLDIYGNEYFRK